MLIVREERLEPKSDKEHSLPLFPVLKIAQNFHLFRHFQAETQYVKQGQHLKITKYAWLIPLLPLVYQWARINAA